MQWEHQAILTSQKLRARQKVISPYRNMFRRRFGAQLDYYACRRTHQKHPEMGIIRLGLALLVVVAHLAINDIPLWMNGHAVSAVRAFFIISGFLMSLVLGRQYLNRSVWNFYVSRLLKLVPLYLVASISALILAALVTGDQPFFQTFDPLKTWRTFDFWQVPIAVQLYTAFTMLTLIGSDMWTWIGFSPNSGEFSVAPSFSAGAITPMSLSPVPQAWTMGLEISFYAVAPFFARRRTRIILLCLGSCLIARLILERYWSFYPTYSRILGPLEIAFFLYGMVIHRLMPVIERNVKSLLVHKFIAGVGVTLLICLTVVAAISETGRDDAASHIVLGLLLPSIFLATQSSRLDNFAGSLSYPIYIFHFPALGLVHHSGIINLAHGKWSELATYVGGVIALAIIAEIAIARPLNRLRTDFGARDVSKEK